MRICNYEYLWKFWSSNCKSFWTFRLNNNNYNIGRSSKQIKKYTYLELDESRFAKYIGAHTRITYQSASVLNQQTFAGLKSKSWKTFSKSFHFQWWGKYKRLEPPLIYSRSSGKRISLRLFGIPEWYERLGPRQYEI